MLDKFLVLLERFVVAHELIAASSAKQAAIDEYTAPAKEPVTKELPVEGEDVIDTPKLTVETVVTKPVTVRAKPEPEDDLADDEPEEEEKPKRKPRQAKVKEEPAADLKQLREDIKTMAKSIAAGESDECADKFDDLLDAYDVRTVNKLADDQVEKFYEEAKALVGKYYEVED